MKKLNTAEIAKAIIDGKDVEFKSADTGEWLPVESVYIPVGCFDDKIDNDRIKPSIDWAQVNNELNYLAIDHNGGTLFKDRPSTDGEGYWVNLNNPVCAIYDALEERWEFR